MFNGYLCAFTPSRQKYVLNTLYSFHQNHFQFIFSTYQEFLEIIKLKMVIAVTKMAQLSSNVLVANICLQHESFNLIHDLFGT